MFQYDPDGELIKFVLELRNLSPVAVPSLSPIREESTTKRDQKRSSWNPPREKSARHQRDIIDKWVDDDDHPITEQERHSLELYAQLTDDEFLHVQELQRVYDESRCYSVQWLLNKGTKELVNGARISAVHL